MELYLVQHGEAAPKDADAARPLTGGGRDDVIRVGRSARAAGVSVAAVYHSGKLRAQQTAEILAAELGVDAPSAVLEGLSPNEDPSLVAGVLDSLGTPALVVGHLPHMSRLCSLLVTGDPKLQIVRFRMGGIVALARGDSGGWGVSWMLTPDVVAPR
jgi:phosphohistidine phosphatase